MGAPSGTVGGRCLKVDGVVDRWYICEVKGRWACQSLEWFQRDAVGGPTFSYISKDAVQPWGGVTGFERSKSHGVTAMHGRHPCMLEGSVSAITQSSFVLEGWSASCPVKVRYDAASLHLLGPVAP